MVEDAPKARFIVSDTLKKWSKISQSLRNSLEEQAEMGGRPYLRMCLVALD